MDKQMVQDKVEVQGTPPKTPFRTTDITEPPSVPRAPHRRQRDRATSSRRYTARARGEVGGPPMILNTRGLIDAFDGWFDSA